jgi:hypothetical protein
MEIITLWMLKNKQPIDFAQNYQDCSSNCPEQNGVKKIGGLPAINNCLHQRKPMKSLKVATVRAILAE